jgi:single-stranded DNA-binding protein
MRVAIDRNGDGSDFVNVTAFGKLAQSCSEYLSKGRQISVQGRLAHSERVKDGERRERHEVVANSVEFLGQRPAQPADAEAQPHRATSRAADPGVARRGP